MPEKQIAIYDESDKKKPNDLNGKPSGSPSIFAIPKHCSGWLNYHLFYNQYQSTFNNHNFNVSNEPVSIYIIHGTADNPTSCMPLKDDLFKTGLDANIATVRIPDLSLKRNSGIQFYAEDLARIIKKNNDKKVIIIGHSRGGLIASYYTENYAKRDRVKVLLTVPVCSPFRGTVISSFASFFFSSDNDTSLRQMRPNTSFLTNLSKSITDNGVVNYHFFTAENDWIVPYEDECIPFGLNPDQIEQCVTKLDKSHGHLSAMHSPEMLEKLQKRISKVFGKAHEHKNSDDQSSQSVNQVPNLS